jgi:hypothetical protein
MRRGGLAAPAAGARPAASEFAFLMVKTMPSVSCGSRTTSKMPADSASDSRALALADVTRTIGAAVTLRIASISAVGTCSVAVVPCRITCAPDSASLVPALAGSAAVPTSSTSGWSARPSLTSARPLAAPVMKTLIGEELNVPSPSS